jgi:hypothetical protein
MACLQYSTVLYSTPQITFRSKMMGQTTENDAKSFPPISLGQVDHSHACLQRCNFEITMHSTKSCIPYTDGIWTAPSARDIPKGVG